MNAQTQTTALATVPTRRPAEIRVVEDAIPVLDTARFEHMQRIAAAMARASLIPDGLKGNDEMTTAANCFLVVNQAVRWNMDPFAVAQCVSVVHGKLMHEGKLIAAVIEQKLGFKLKFEWSGEGECMTILVSNPHDPNEHIEGSVADWKTDGKGTPWVPKQYKKMLAYRGTREWCRLFAPGLILGIYTPDEMEGLEDRSNGSPSRAAIEPPPPSLDAPTPLEQAIAEQPPAAGAGEPQVIMDEHEERPATAADTPAEPEQSNEPPTPPEPPSPTVPKLVEVDAGEIPPSLRRTKEGDEAKKRARAKLDDDAQQKWLADVRNQVAAAPTIEKLGILQTALLADMEKKVSPGTWTTATAVFQQRAAELTPPEEPEVPAEPPFDGAQWLRDLEGAVGGAEDAESLGQIKERVLLPAKDKVDTATWEKGVKLYREQVTKVQQALDV